MCCLGLFGSLGDTLNRANRRRLATDRSGHEERSINTRSKSVHRVSCRGVKERQVNAGVAYLRTLSMRSCRTVPDASQAAGVGCVQHTAWVHCDGESRPRVDGLLCIVPASTDITPAEECAAIAFIAVGHQRVNSRIATGYLTSSLTGAPNMARPSI